MFLNTFSPTRSPNPEAGSWVVAPHQGRPFGTARKRSWSYPLPPQTPLEDPLVVDALAAAARTLATPLQHGPQRHAGSAPALVPAVSG